MAFLRNFFSNTHKKNAEIVNRSFDIVVEAARTPKLYSDFSIPDTPIGRFESLSAHLVLLLMRLENMGEKANALAVEITEQFFQDVDHSIRELGIGDAGVPKRMKKLASMFYGRMEAYEKPIKAGDTAGLAVALARNLFPTETSRGKAIEQHYDMQHMEQLGEALILRYQALCTIADEEFLSANFHFAPLEQS